MIAVGAAVSFVAFGARSALEPDAAPPAELQLFPADAHFATDDEKQKDQLAGIVRNSPVSKGGDWLALWLGPRLPSVTRPDRTAGNW